MMTRISMLSVVLLAAACGSDSSSSGAAPDAQQTQAIASGTGAAAPTQIQLATLAGRMDTLVTGNLSGDFFGVHLDASVTCKDDRAQTVPLCTGASSADLHLDISGHLELGTWRGALEMTSDLTAARLTAEDTRLLGTSHVVVSTTTFDRSLTLDTDSDLTYHGDGSVTGTIEGGIDATIDGAHVHVDDAMLTIAVGGKVHLFLDGQTCFAIESTTGAATEVDMTACE